MGRSFSPRSFVCSSLLRTGNVLSLDQSRQYLMHDFRADEVAFSLVFRVGAISHLEGDGAHICDEIIEPHHIGSLEEAQSHAQLYLHHAVRELLYGQNGTVRQSSVSS